MDEKLLIEKGFLPLSGKNWNIIEINHHKPETETERTETRKYIKESIGSINGIYVYEQDNKILYVGKGKPIYRRVRNRYKRCYYYDKTTSIKQCAFWSLHRGIVKVYYKELEGEDDRKKIETSMQKILKPIYEVFKKSHTEETAKAILKANS